MRRLLLFPVPLLLLLSAAYGDEILVITPDEFAPALRAWREHREKQGWKVTVRPRVEARGPGGPKFVLLLGDVRRVPCTYAPADAILIWEDEKEIATDNHLADLDGDDLPDVAVGRLPADSREEAEAMLAKVVAYETDRDFGTWRRRVDVIAGIAGFGETYDKLIESASTTLLSQEIPAGYDLHVTWANAASPFCPPPSAVADTVVERFNEGALFVTYMGHGSPRSLDRVRWGDRAYEIFDEDHVERLEARRGAPIAYLCCCSTGHFDGDLDCLAEFMLKEPGGPVAVIASSRVSMPYANGVLSKEMLGALFREGAGTVGEMLRLAKRRMAGPPEDPLRQQIEMMATFALYKMDPKARAAERREHLWLYNLLGDPSMRIPRAADLSLACAASVARGTKLAVEGTCTVAGDALVELVRERTPDVPRREGDTDAAFAKCYAGANAWVKAEAKTRCEGGAFKTELSVPADLAPGLYFVRAYVTGKDGAALGAREVSVRKPAPTSERKVRRVFLKSDEGDMIEGWLDPKGRFTPKAGAERTKVGIAISPGTVVTRDQVTEILEPRETPPEGE